MENNVLYSKRFIYPVYMCLQFIDFDIHIYPQYGLLNRRYRIIKIHKGILYYNKIFPSLEENNKGIRYSEYIGKDIIEVYYNKSNKDSLIYSVQGNQSKKIIYIANNNVHIFSFC